jgi:hypothetical protein
MDFDEVVRKKIEGHWTTRLRLRANPPFSGTLLIYLAFTGCEISPTPSQAEQRIPSFRPEPWQTGQRGAKTQSRLGGTNGSSPVRFRGACHALRNKCRVG